MNLKAKAITSFQANLLMCRKHTQGLNHEEDMKNMARMIEMFEENDDVQNIWHNWENEDEYEG